MEPPRACCFFFGPPGTGKTTFARAIASRLGWPFVEIYPSRLATDHGGLALALRDTFESIGRLERVAVFIDEVEEIAPARTFPPAGEPGRGSHGVVNEMLKIIPAFRERDSRLLICATNSIPALSCLPPPGVFETTRSWGRPTRTRGLRCGPVVARADRSDVDVNKLVAASTLTPADMSLCAQTAAQRAFERDARGQPQIPRSPRGNDNRVSRCDLRYAPDRKRSRRRFP